MVAPTVDIYKNLSLLEKLLKNDKIITVLDGTVIDVIIIKNILSSNFKN
jgi:hypothetical protein